MSDLSIPNANSDRASRKRQKIRDSIALVESAQSYLFRGIALLFLMGVEAALVLALFWGKTVEAGLLVAITTIAVLPIIVIRAFDISVLNLSKEGIQAEMVRTEIVGEVLSKVDRLFALAMSDSIFQRLRLLNGPETVAYAIDDDLKRQLFYLQDIGYIEFTPGSSLQESGLDLRSCVKVTERGRDFLSLRERVLKAGEFKI